MKRTNLYPILLLMILLGSSCRKEVPPIPITPQVVPTEEPKKVTGLFVLNQGNMGSNKASIDFLDLRAGKYLLNIYPTQNPQIVKELGDVGNDIGIYGTKLYVVINCSHYVEIMDASNAKHLGKVDVLNCRNLLFHEGKAYVSSYAGPVMIDPEARPGKVVEIDTLTYQITREVVVGYQPEEMVEYLGKLYVANSGGYRYPNYDTTISVIDLETFEVERTIDVAINLHRMEIDKKGHIYVSSRGDYYDIPSDVFVVDAESGQVIKSLGVAASSMHLSGDSLYLVATEWNYNTFDNTISYTLYDIEKETIVTKNFITDGTDKQIETPYGITTHPVTKDIFIPDAGNYVSPGTLYCFSPEGKLKWKVETGDIPGHFAWSTIPFELNDK